MRFSNRTRAVVLILLILVVICSSFQISAAVESMWVAPNFRYEIEGTVRRGFGDGEVESSTTTQLFETTPDDAFPRDPVKTLILESVEDETGLKTRFESTRYEFYPAAESLVWFENVGDNPTLSLKDVQILDVVLPTGGAAKLTSGYGEDPDPKRNFALETKALSPGETQQFTPREAYSSFGAFPYFLIEGKERTYIIAIGWTGDWTAQFTADENGGVRVVAGQTNVDLFLRPGEKIRTPRITLFETPTGADVVNLWRDWYRRYVMPRQENVVLRPKFALDVFYRGELYDKVTAEEQIDAIQKARALGYPVEALWVDAGWYLRQDAPKTSVGNWFGVGDWTPDPLRFPEGFRPVVAELENVAPRDPKGELTLWFEPERVHRTKLSDKLRQYVVPDIELVESYRMNMASPTTVDYLSRTIGDAIVENGVSIYRQDSNGAGPLRFLESLEATDPNFQGRRGYAENLYVCGLYQFWNNLKARQPNLVFDVCASGGRRVDLEILRLGAVPLHYSDVGYFDFVEKQHMHDTLNRWLVYYKNIDPHDLDETGEYDVYRTTIDLAPFSTIRPYFFTNYTDAKRRYAERYFAVRELLVDGDYYLLNGGFTEADWTVWQFDDSRGGDERGRPLSRASDAAARLAKDAPFIGSARQTGCVVCVRNGFAEEETFHVAPQKIDVDATYLWENLESGDSTTISGSELAAGVDVTLPKKSGAVWKYTRLTEHKRRPIERLSLHSVKRRFF